LNALSDLKGYAIRKQSCAGFARGFAYKLDKCYTREGYILLCFNGKRYNEKYSCINGKPKSTQQGDCNGIILRLINKEHYMIWTDVLGMKTLSVHQLLQWDPNPT
jgi:hypothetical protein